MMFFDSFFAALMAWRSVACVDMRRSNGAPMIFSPVSISTEKAEALFHDAVTPDPLVQRQITALDIPSPSSLQAGAEQPGRRCGAEAANS